MNLFFFFFFFFSWFKRAPNNGKGVVRRDSSGDYEGDRGVSWSKYLVSSGAEIKAEGEEEWSADMSQLYIGSKFASGRHSRIYRGIYKQRDVAIKLMSHPEEDKNLANLLDTHFASEVAFLFALQHPNIISVSFVFRFFTLCFFRWVVEISLHPLFFSRLLNIFEKVFAFLV